MQACDRFKQYDWSKWNLLHVGLNRSIHEILAMFKGRGGGGGGTRVSNGISGRKNVFEIFSQKSN